MAIKTSLPDTCSTLSLQAAEPMLGSATQTTRYILLENHDAWGAKAIEESAIPESAKQALKDFQKSDQLSKALFIHRPQESISDRLRLFVVSTTAESQTAFEFSLAKYEDLLELNLQDVFNHPERYADHKREEPLLLVCTNGRRDPCCSLLGIQVFRALDQATQNSPTPLVWQSSHLGGHRFAANLIVLPHGLLYGRVEASSALNILAAARSQKIHLPNLRGRSAYPPPAQAAEAALLSRLNEMDLDALQLQEVEVLDENTWMITFIERSSDQPMRLTVHAETSSQSVFESCQMDKTTAIIHYRVSFGEA